MNTLQTYMVTLSTGQANAIDADRLHVTDSGIVKFYVNNDLVALYGPTGYISVIPATQRKP